MNDYFKNHNKQTKCKLTNTNKLINTNATKYKLIDRHDGVVLRASALQSVDLGFIPQVKSYQKTLKNGIHSFPA